MTHLLHRIPLRHLTRFKNTELGELYVSTSIKTFAEGLAGIFVPIYLLTLGFSLSDVFFYYILWFFPKAFLQIPIGKLVASIGPKHVLSISYILRIVFLTALAAFPVIGWSLYWTAPLGGIVVCLFYTSYHIAFSNIHGKHEGKEIAGMNILIALASASAPFIGGLLAQIYGLRPVLLIAVALMILSIRPLFKTGELVVETVDFSLKRVPRKAVLKIFPFTLLEGLEGPIAVVLWPLYLSLAFFGEDSFGGLGLLFSLSFMAVIGIELMAGKFLDAGRSKQLVIGSSLFLALGNAMRIFVTRPLGFFFADFIPRAANIGAKDTYFYRLYSHSRTDYGAEFITLIEAFGNIVKLSLFAALYAFSAYVSQNTLFFTAFIATSVAAVLVGLITYSRLRYEAISK